MGKKSGTKHTKYYDLLGVETTASDEDIRKAYKRMALRLHPDKNGGTDEAQQKFMEMKNAYDVLSDSQKRELYDTMGEDGIKIYEDYGSMGPTELAELMFRSFLASGLGARALVVGILLLVVGFFLLIPIFWCLRVNGSISWNWAAVFVPMWILDAFILLCACFSACSTPKEESNPDDTEAEMKKISRERKIAAMLSVLQVVLFVLTQVFIVLRLQESVSWGMGVVLLPWWILEGIDVLRQSLRAKVMLQEYRENVQADQETKEEGKKVIQILIARKFMWIILRVLLAILIALKVDDTISVSWWVVFLPLWILLIIEIGNMVLGYVAARRVEKGMASGDSEDQAMQRASKGALFCSILCFLIVMSPFFLLVERLQTASYSAFYVLLPWFIILGLLLLLVVCGICCAGKGLEEEEDEVDVNEFSGSPSNASYGAVNNDEKV